MIYQASAAYTGKTGYSYRRKKIMEKVYVLQSALLFICIVCSKEYFRI